MTKMTAAQARVRRPMRALLKTLAPALLGSTVLPAAFLAGSVSAQTITNRIVSFGDSLTDNGNAFALVGAQPTGPYASGRFTNDRVFVEYLAASGTLARSGAQTLVGGLPVSTGNADFAFGGSRTDTLATPFPGIQTQINGFVAAGGRFNATDVVTLWGGANDLFQNIATAAATPATAQAVFGATATTAATNTVRETQQLASLGARTIVVLGLPDFSRLPAFAGAPAQLAGFGSATFNTVLLQGLAGVAAANPGANIVSIDTTTAFNAVLANPGQFGITNTTTPCLITGTCGNALFYDGVHPTDIGHRIVAAVVFNNLAVGQSINAVSSLADIGFEGRRTALLSSFEQFGAVRSTGDRTEFFLSATGNHVERDGSASRPRFDSTTGGLRFGGIRSINENWRAGLAINAVTGSGRSNAISFDPTHIGADVLVGWTQGAYFVNAGIGADFIQFSDYKRQLVGLPWQNTADPNGYTFSVAGEAGLHYSIGAIELTPQVRLSYLRASLNSFAEIGNAATVSVNGRAADGLTGAVELKASARLTDTAKVTALIGYEDLLTGAADFVRAQLINSTAQPVAVGVRQPLGAGLLFGAGAQAQLTPDVALFANYRGSALNDITHHQGNIGLTAKF
ncbi:MAG: autotransporter domain-containing protein [Beijerinckiaceae bacterium]|nr:autotransporter domain-containing protein [Beijerinckiaceae bacterium]